MVVLVLLAALMPAGPIGAETVYTGMPNGDAIIKNASFTDISGNVNADSILRMAVYSIINEYGNVRYRPNDNATRQEVLAALVRAMGRESDAVAKGEALKLQNPNLSTVDAYIRGHIEVAKTSGIITAKEIDAMAVLTKAEKTAVEKEVAEIAKKNWKMTKLQRDTLLKSMLEQRSYDKALKTAASREETGLWTAKALGLEPVKGEKTLELYAYKDWKNIATANLPHLEALHRSGILKGETAANYAPKGKVKRGELADVLSKTADSALAALQLTTGYGKVVSKTTSNDVRPFEQVSSTDIAVQTPDGTIINMNASKRTAGGKTTSQSIPVIKGGRIGNESLIQNNDIVEYTLTKNNQVLLLQVGRLKVLKGRFRSYSPQLGTVQMTDQNGRQYQFRLLPNTVTTASKIPIDISKATGDMPATAIYEGNTLRAIDLEVSSDKINNQDMAVKILFADPLGRILKVEDDYLNRQYLQLAEDADIYINDKLQGIEAIGFDQDAVLKVADNRVVEVRVYTDLPTEDEPYTQILTGRVRDLIGNNLFISPDNAPGTQSTYILGNNVPIIKDRKNVSKYKLQPGERVKIYVETSMGDYISRIELQGSGVKIANLYKGDIKDVLPATGEVILTNVYAYGYYDWVKEGDYIKYKLSGDAELYDGNSLINVNKLKDSVGKTIYAVSKVNYGDEEIVHGLLKDGYEAATYKKIDDVKYTASQLTLSDGRILDYLKGSIVIKDGKLMDTSDLQRNSSAFVIQNRGTTGASTAQVISLDSFTGLGGYNISKGYLHTMGEDYFTMESSFRLANNNWESYKGFTFQFSNDTYIYDNIFQNKAITAAKFAESRFKPYTYTWPNYSAYNYGKEFHEDDIYHKDYTSYRNSAYFHEHSLLYTVTDEYGYAVGINIFTKDREQFNPNKTNDERMTSGQIQKIDMANNALTLTRVMEFSPLYQDWRPAMTSTPLDTSKAIVLKDGKYIGLDKLTTEDRVYAVSLDGFAVLILAE